MGLIKDMIKARIYGSEIRGAIREARGEKSNISQALEMNSKRIQENLGVIKTDICAYCGSHVGKDKIKAKCMKALCLKWLCSKCAKRCKKCGKMFCPKHIKKHKCK